MSEPIDPELVLPGVEIRGPGLDHWAEIRHLHAQAFRATAGAAVDPATSDTFVARIYEPDYTLTLQTHDLLVAWHDARPLGTAGWVPFDQQARVARITSVYVSPLFSRLGLGRTLVSAAEARALSAGYHAYAARTFQPTEGFFESLGYGRSSQGVQSVGREFDIPVVFMRKPRLEGDGSSVDPGMRQPGTGDSTG